MINVALMPQYFSWAGGLEFLRNLSIGLSAVSTLYQINICIILNHSFKDSPLFPLLNDYFKQSNCSEDYIYYESAQSDLADILISRKVDIVLAVNGDLGANFPVPWIAYIPDFQHKYLYNYFTEHECFSRETVFAARLRDCKALVVNAKSVKRDLLKFYPWIDENRVFALPFSPSPLPEWLMLKPEVATKKYNITEPYFIICNQFWLHKDHLTAFKAFAALDNKNIQLVCTGIMEDYRNPTYIQELNVSLEHLGIKTRVHMLGHIPKIDQISLLKGALALIQPTRFEGGPGGGATYDAVAVGTPVILSDIEVNKEILLEHVKFFAVGNEKSLANLMEQYAAQAVNIFNTSDLFQQMSDNQKLLGDMLFQAIQYTLNRYNFESK